MIREYDYVKYLNDKIQKLSNSKEDRDILHDIMHTAYMGISELNRRSSAFYLIVLHVSDPIDDYGMSYYYIPYCKVTRDMAEKDLSKLCEDRLPSEYSSEIIELTEEELCDFRTLQSLETMLIHIQKLQHTPYAVAMSSRIETEDAANILIEKLDLPSLGEHRILSQETI